MGTLIAPGLWRCCHLVRSCGERRAVVLDIAAAGAVLRLAAPVADIKAAPPEERRFLRLVSRVADGLRCGTGLAAQRAEADDLLTLLDDLEAFEAGFRLPQRVRS